MTVTVTQARTTQLGPCTRAVTAEGERREREKRGGGGKGGGEGGEKEESERGKEKREREGRERGERERERERKRERKRGGEGGEEGRGEGRRERNRCCCTDATARERNPRHVTLFIASLGTSTAKSAAATLLNAPRLPPDHRSGCGSELVASREIGIVWEHVCRRRH